jgi:cytochrome c biogenesis protein CcmG, thiol:disulfide interchange protein DsbE
VRRVPSNLLGSALAVAIVAAAGAGSAVAAEAPGMAPSGAVGKSLEAKLERLEGERLRLSELRGAPLLLELWATWCLPCQDQARILADLAAELSGRGIAVLAVDEGESDKVVRRFLAAHPSHFPVALDRLQVVADQLGVGELPALALLDADGKVVDLRLGLTQRDDILTLIDSVAAP